MLGKVILHHVHMVNLALTLNNAVVKEVIESIILDKIESDSKMS